jgi:hypothetical protein
MYRPMVEVPNTESVSSAITARPRMLPVGALSIRIVLPPSAAAATAPMIEYTPAAMTT